MAIALNKPKVIVVMPAYNAAKTLRITYDAIPKDERCEHSERAVALSTASLRLDRAETIRVFFRSLSES